jgi:hypothetical protein
VYLKRQLPVAGDNGSKWRRKSVTTSKALTFLKDSKIIKY